MTKGQREFARLWLGYARAERRRFAAMARSPAFPYFMMVTHPDDATRRRFKSHLMAYEVLHIFHLNAARAPQLRAFDP